MSLNDPTESPTTLQEIRAARDQAEFLRDQLQAEYDRLLEDAAGPQVFCDDPERFRMGLETFSRAIDAADRAIASLDQLLAQSQRVHNDPADS